MPGRARHAIITLTTDFGLIDSYVAQMKGAILSQCRGAAIVDVTHLIPRHDVIAGSFALERALAAFPRGTIHVAVVDPGVGTSRKLLLASLAGQTVLCPDNGLITWAWHRFPSRVARELTWRPARSSATFHGRDVLAPVAARLANGTPARSVAGAVVQPVLLDLAPATADATAGRVIHVDVYGNVTTNVLAERVVGMRSVRVGRRTIPVHRTYGDVLTGKPLALIGSSGLLEIAVREASAADVLRLRVGDTVRLT